MTQVYNQSILHECLKVLRKGKVPMRKLLFLSLLVLFFMVACTRSDTGGRTTDPNQQDPSQGTTDPNQQAPNVTSLADWLNLLYNTSTNHTITFTGKENGVVELYAEMKQASNVNYVYLSEGGFYEVEQYILQEDGSWVTYMAYDNNDWFRMNYVDPYDLLDELFENNLQANWFARSNNAYELRTEHYADVFGSDFDDITGFTITFTDRSMLWFITGVDDTDEVTLEIEFTDFGTTQITLPDFSELVSNPGSDPEALLSDYLNSSGENRHQISITTAGHYEIYVISVFDSYGVLEDVNGTVLAEDDDSYGGWDFKMTVYLEPGTYYVIVTGYDDSDYGSYSLYVNLRTGYNPTYTGYLEAGEENAYTFTISSPGPYRIYAVTTFDSYGVLKNAAGDVIAEDDDSNGSLDFRINITLEVGTYTIVISGYDYYSYGYYDIFIEER